MDLKLLRGFYLEIDVVHVRFFFAAVEQPLATGIVDFVIHFTEHRVAADDEAVILACQERQHQLGFVTWDEDGAVVVIVLDVTIQCGEAIFLCERSALSVGCRCKEPEGQQEDECMFHCYSTSLLLNAPRTHRFNG
mgnify:CR=1 FL=1